MRQVLPLFALTLLAACGSANGRETDGGPKTTRSFDVSNFDGVVLAASDDVRIVEGANFAVSATATAKVLDQLEFTVTNGVLEIGRKKERKGWMSWRDDNGAVIDVTMPIIHKAVIAGSGDMRVAATANDQFSGAITGSGDLTIANVRATDANLSIAGSGDLTASGTAKQLGLSIVGSGDINTTGLKAEQLSASIAGSGDIRAMASGSASASIVGSGDIEISGIKDCKTSQVGSGEIRCVG
jgi:hypothetical protein